MRQHVEGPAYQPRPSFAELAHAAAALGGIDDHAVRRLEHRLVRARAERGAFAGHYQHAAISIVADRMEVTLKLEYDCLVEAIAALGPIEGDRRNRTVVVDEKIRGHAFSSRCRRAYDSCAAYYNSSFIYESPQRLILSCNRLARQ